MKCNHYYLFVFIILIFSCQNEEKLNSNNNTDKFILNLNITKKNEVLLENKIISPDSINSAINTHVKTYSSDELNRLTIKMIVDKEVDMLLLMKVRNHLKNSKLKIEYSQN